MPPRRKRVADPTGSDVFTTNSAEATEPIGSSAEYHLSQVGGRDRQNDNATEIEKHTVTLRPLHQSSPKKRKADNDVVLYLSDEEFADAFEKIAEKIWKKLSSQTVMNAPADEAHRFREEMQNSIKEVQTHFTQLLSDAVAKVQAEAEKHAEVMLQRVRQSLKNAPQATCACTTASSTNSRGQEHVTQEASPNGRTQGELRSKQATQQTWSKIVQRAAKSATAWTTVVNNRNKKTKKHPIEQRRILFLRSNSAPASDPREVMFEVNKALAHAKADVTVRLTNLRYSKKGHLSGLMNESACADDLLGYGPLVLTAAQEVDPTITDVEKTERWRKMRVHGVTLDRYLKEGGLGLAREEIELTGVPLAYEPHWIKNDTLAERFHTGAIKQSTLVVTVKSKQASDTMLAKGLLFGGKRHEVERFWLPGEGGICTHCCGPDHFGKCTEQAKCFVCAGEHEGAKHLCATTGCGKKSEPCDHEVARCANCGGQHMATSRRCPERMQRARKHKEKPSTEMRSSPPTALEDQTQIERREVDAECMDEDVTTADAGGTSAAQPPAVSMRMAGMRPSSPWSDSTSNSDLDIEPSTPTPRGKGQTLMSVDDDSAAT